MQTVLSGGGLCICFTRGGNFVPFLADFPEALQATYQRQDQEVSPYYRHIPLGWYSAGRMECPRKVAGNPFRSNGKPYEEIRREENVADKV